MVEKYELNLFAKHRHLLKDVLPDQPESQRIGVTLRGTVGDPLFVRIGELDRSLRESGHGVAFGSCVVKRTYSKEEIERAELFFINIPFTHVAGEEYGTEYQEAKDCEQQAFDMEWPEVNKCRPVPVMVPCGICSKQVGLLRIPFRKLSKKKDIFRAWGGELIVSERLAAVIRDGSFAGSVVFPIRDVKGEQTAPFDFSSSAGVELLSIATAKGMQPNDAKFWWWLYKDAPKSLLDEVIVRQKTDGAWDESLGEGKNRQAIYTGTGFPRVFYLAYHMYRNYFPLLALTTYQRAMQDAA